MHRAIDPLVTPRVLAPDGVYEAQYFAMGGGVALVAVRDGQSLDYTVVFRCSEYEREFGRLERVLRGDEAPARVCVSGAAGSLAVMR